MRRLMDRFRREREERAVKFIRKENIAESLYECVCVVLKKKKKKEKKKERSNWLTGGHSNVSEKWVLIGDLEFEERC